MFVVKNLTIVQSYWLLIYMLGRMPFFKQNGYHVPIPQNALFEELVDKPEKIKTMDHEKYFDEYKKHVYEPVNLKPIKKELEKIKKLCDGTLVKLKVLHKNWGFKVFDKYIINPIYYSPGGGYDSNKGTLTIRVDKKGQLIGISIDTILHESVHMGIEECIIQKFNLSHDEKECLVDIICSEYLELPNYKVQNKFVNESLKKLITYDAIKNNLPDVIKKYKQKIK